MPNSHKAARAQRTARSRKTVRAPSYETSSKTNKIDEIVRIGKGLLPHAADAAEFVLPFTPLAPLAPALKGVRKVLGFDERRVLGSAPMSGIGQDGGTIIQTMNAPSAFARQQLKTGLRTLQTGSDSQLMWVCDLTNIVYMDVEDGTPVYTPNVFEINPLNDILFPGFYTQFEDWERWRPLEMILHYVHYAPTSETGAVCLAANFDPEGDESAYVFGNFEKISTLNHSAVGSIYEDFSLQVQSDIWKEGQWLYNDPTVDTVSDARLNNAGSIAWATDAGQQAGTLNVGFFYVEMLFEVAGRRVPYAANGISSRVLRLGKSLKTKEEREAYLDLAMKAWREAASKDLAIYAPKRSDPVKEVCKIREKYRNDEKDPPSAAPATPVSSTRLPKK